MCVLKHCPCAGLRLVLFGTRTFMATSSPGAPKMRTITFVNKCVTTWMDETSTCDGPKRLQQDRSLRDPLNKSDSGPSREPDSSRYDRRILGLPLFSVVLMWVLATRFRPCARCPKHTSNRQPHRTSFPSLPREEARIGRPLLFVLLSLYEEQRLQHVGCVQTSSNTMSKSI